ncbi:type II toxin-antitoxin system HipA family toxin [Bartonella sp. A05]|uniref:type II toxin-antitoxin system HipA family toxin n=1 Tax=Bartonella sp. A05 TaxID=2967261 RepID=UPI0022A9704E|nr:type II toxin-antitoxin system HipA family toxin [Bartonella sp. A05]MCZ2203688.1 type II toxin-antitoxin system HipA family toxin [Bartonella sp. A05]
MSFEFISHIKVSLCFDDKMLPVGRLARRERKIYFEYDRNFIKQGLEISPIKCPLKPGVCSFDPFLFEGLPGVFNDSLPDGWGRLLLDRQMRTRGILAQELSPLDRLAHVGLTGMGALVYEPDYTDEIMDSTINIDVLAQQVQQVLSGEATEILTELIALNGSSAGARPKAMIGLHTNRQDIIYGTHQLNDDYQPWLVKFPNFNDGVDAGAIEYVYALMAIDAGLEMPDVHLFPAQTGCGYFAVQRFDRKENRRFHMHTVCGLLHSNFRTPSLDYDNLMALTMILTKDIREVEKMYRLAVFNVFAHNRDDHAKNFSYLMDRTGEWKLSPAYDLTFSSGFNGEQSTVVMGEGKHPGRDELIKLGLKATLPKTTIDAIIEQTRDSLSKWPRLAKEYGVTSSNIHFIASKITTDNI